MPTCENCNQTWTWKQTVRKMFTINPDMSCPYCGEKQYQTIKSRRKSFIFNFIILIPLLLNVFFDIPGVILLSLFLILAVAMWAVYPFFMELGSKEEYF